MTGERPRVQKVLAYLYDAEDQVRPREIADAIGESPLNVGKDLHSLKERGLAGSEGEGQWRITTAGRERIEGSEPKETGRKEREKETTETIPSQSDLFKSIGEKLGVGSRKGDIRLDAVTYYVQRTADLDNLTSVWNALSEMGVANDVKKRWIKIYAQNLPGKEIPEELREKLEGEESERIKTGTGEISAKPKRFSVVNGEIIGDPEGDYNFKEALQYMAQQRGAPAEAINPLATMVEAMKMGPEMATSTLTAMIPLITKEPPKPSGEGDLLLKLDSLGLLKKTGEEGRASELELISKLSDLGLIKKSEGGEGAMLSQLDALGLLKKPGEGEGSETIKALQTEVRELTESLHKRDMDTVKGAVVSLSNQVSELRKEMSDQGHLEGRYALMDKTIGTIDNQLTGFRSDARPLLDSLAYGGGRVEPKIRTPEEKARIARGLKEAVALEREAHQLEDELLFGVPPSPEESGEVTAAPAPSAEMKPDNSPKPKCYVAGQDGQCNSELKAPEYCSNCPWFKSTMVPFIYE